MFQEENNVHLPKLHKKSMSMTDIGAIAKNRFVLNISHEPGPDEIKLFSYST